MKYTVSQVTLCGENVDIIESLDDLCFPGEQPVSFDGTWWWLAYDEADRPVAYAGLAALWGDRGFLCRVGVVPSARGQGLHRRLVRARERGARQHELSRLLTYTAYHNVASGNNLIGCGYRLYSPSESWGTPGALYWYRDI